MIYSLLIQTSPDNLSIITSALEFAQALLKKNHRLLRVFFYGDGVLLGSQGVIVPQDEPDIYKAWRAFIEAEKIDAVVCIAAALKRGVLNLSESQRYGTAATLAPAYDLSGLGQLTEAALNSDRLITFA